MRILRYHQDWRSILFVLLAQTVYLLQWLGVIRHPLLYALSFFLAFICCVVNHNHHHHPTFIHRPMNGIFQLLLSFAMGVPCSVIIAMHNHNHHVHNNRPEDFVRADIVRFRWNLLNLLLFPFVALLRYAPVKSRDIKNWATTHPHLYRQLWLERLVFYPATGALLIIQPLESLIYFVLPWLFGQWGIIAINHLQHDGCDPSSAWNHSRNFTGKCLNWWVLNNGYHTAHHERPGLHWSQLPKLHAEIRPAIHPSLERRSLLLALFEFYLVPGHRPGRIEKSIKETGL